MGGNTGYKSEHSALGGRGPPLVLVRQPHHVVTPRPHDKPVE